MGRQEQFEDTATLPDLARFLLAPIFFITAPIAIAVSLFTLHITTKAQPIEKAVAVVSQVPFYGAKIFAALPQSSTTIAAGISEGDARPEIVRKYLERYDSPLTPYADKFVEYADRYGLDFRLTAAIAQQESNLCRLYPIQTFNCWGWGIHSQGTLGFSSFEEGIETVSRGIREEYIDKGYVTVEEIMKKYTPLSNGSWAYGVTKFMSEME